MLTMIILFVQILIFAVSSEALSMEEHNIVPKVIDVAPTKTIEVTYPGGLKVNNGNELTPTQVKDEPSVSWEADANSLYTLVMTDPLHLLGRPETNFEILHWLVGNIPGNDLKKGNLITRYVGSGPPEGTGLHKYIFLVYKQNEKIQFEGNVNSDSPGFSRANFFVKKFAEKYNLGDPVAGNFYQAQYDESVPKMHQARRRN